MASTWMQQPKWCSCVNVAPESCRTKGLSTVAAGEAVDTGGRFDCSPDVASRYPQVDRLYPLYHWGPELHHVKAAHVFTMIDEGVHKLYTTIYIGLVDIDDNLHMRSNHHRYDNVVHCIDPPYRKWVSSSCMRLGACVPCRASVSISTRCNPQWVHIFASNREHHRDSRFYRTWLGAYVHEFRTKLGAPVRDNIRICRDSNRRTRGERSSTQTDVILDKTLNSSMFTNRARRRLMLMISSQCARWQGGRTLPEQQSYKSFRRAKMGMPLIAA